MDGTLLNREKKLTPYSEAVLKEAIRQGVTVLVATGRPLSGVPEFMREFPGMRYILTANGARIYDRKDGIICCSAICYPTRTPLLCWMSLKNMTRSKMCITTG